MEGKVMLMIMPIAIMALLWMMAGQITTQDALWATVIIASITAGAVGAIQIFGSGLGEAASWIIFATTAMSLFWGFLVTQASQIGKTIPNLPLADGTTFPVWGSIMTAMSLSYILGMVFFIRGAN